MSHFAENLKSIDDHEQSQEDLHRFESNPQIDPSGVIKEGVTTGVGDLVDEVILVVTKQEANIDPVEDR